MSVVRLASNSTFCVDLPSLSIRIREFADRVEAGDFGEVDRVFVLAESGGAITNEIYGRETNGFQLIGLLDVAKAKAMGLFP